MPGTKLKDLKLISVDLVKQGANPDADICLFKSAEDITKLPDDRAMKKILSMLKKTFASTDSEEKVIKDAITFGQIKNNREVREKLWQYLSALEESVRSITDDTELDNESKTALFESSLSQFNNTMKELFPLLIDYEPTSSIKELNKGELKKMDIDTSNLTKEEKEEFEKLYNKCKAKTKKSAESETNPVLKAALDEVHELKKQLEIKALEDIAKKYEILGKKPEELAVTLYEMKKSGEANYKAFISALDDSLEVYNKSGIFGEIGKSAKGHDSGGQDPVKKIDGIAKEYREKDPSLGYYESIAKAWENNPDLIEKYEKGE